MSKRLFLLIIENILYSLFWASVHPVFCHDVHIVPSNSEKICSQIAYIKY